MFNVRRVGTAGCPAAPLTEPDLRATHPALWIVDSKRQTKLVRDFCWRVRNAPEVVGWSPLGSEPRIRVRHIDPLPVTAMPDAPPTVGGAGSLSRVSTPLQEMTVQKARPFLLVNDDGPQPALQVCIVPSEFGRSFFSADSKVPDPSSEIFVYFPKTIT